MWLQIPKYVVNILKKLETNGYQAYIVGGCIRDACMHRRPHDWDIATSAGWEQVLGLFPHSVPTGVKYGTVTVLTGKMKTEVTTFRTDGAYTNGRSPESVTFLTEIRGDLGRRDFTMNAMAADVRGQITDPFGGQEDIARGLVRCVGEARVRFEEDALRMFRALRFAARFGFQLEEETRQALYCCAPLCAALSGERVRSETEQILCSPRPETLFVALRAGMLEKWIPGVGEAELVFLRRMRRDKTLRWAGFFHALEQQGFSPETLGKSLRLDNHTFRTALTAARLSRAYPSTKVEVKGLLAQFGAESVLTAAEILDAKLGGNHRKEVRAILAGGECVFPGQLCLGGRELMALGLRGMEIGRMQRALLEHVHAHPEDNEPEILWKLAEKKRRGL